LSPLFLYMGERSPTLISSGMEYCEIMLLIKSSIYNWVYREYSDRKAPFYLALLDTKSVFDVVDIDILMRKLFLLGVQPSTWHML
jgi:hypothetical protein